MPTDEHRKWVQNALGVQKGSFPNRAAPGGGGSSLGSDAGSGALGELQELAHSSKDGGGKGANYAQGLADSISDRFKVAAALGGDVDLHDDLDLLSGKDMPMLLDVMERLKKVGKLDDFSSYVTTEKQRVWVAIFTVRADFNAQWQGLVAKLNEKDRKAVLERVPPKTRDMLGGTGAESGPAASGPISREDAEKALTAFLTKVLAAQGGQALRVTEPVRLAGVALATALPDSDIAIKQYLQGNISGKPAVVAHEIAKRLPASLPRSNLASLDRLSVNELEITRPQSASEALAGLFSKPVQEIIKGLPKSWQDTIMKGVADAIAAGIVAIADKKMKDSPLDDKTKEAISKSVEAAIKQKDKDKDKGGSPFAHDPPPPSAGSGPTPSPGEEIHKTPEIPVDGSFKP